MSICQSCVYQTHAVMLSGYCIIGERCDRCKRVTDLALVAETPKSEREEKTMSNQVISSWRDMNQFGFNLLTGEACGLNYRGLVDLTAKALEIVKRTIGAVELQTPRDYNGGDAVGSMLLPYSMLEPLAVFALFSENAQHVLIEYQADTYSGTRITGFDGTYTWGSISKLCQDNNIHNYRLLTYPEQRNGVTAGMSNIHQMSGRIS